MRIGLNTGTVVVGRIGDDLRMDYTAEGDTTNVASRLESLCPPGSVLVSEATHRAIEGFFETRDLGEMRVKGHEALVHAYEVLRARGRQARVEVAAERGLTPLVGREREVAQLEDLFRQVKAATARSCSWPARRESASRASSTSFAAGSRRPGNRPPSSKDAASRSGSRCRSCRSSTSCGEFRHRGGRRRARDHRQGRGRHAPHG